MKSIIFAIIAASFALVFINALLIYLMIYHPSIAAMLIDPIGG